MSDVYDVFDNIIVLNEENGDEAEFEFLDLIEYQGDDYIVLFPLGEDNQEVVIFKIEPGESEDEESYVGIEDKNVLNTVFAIFKDKHKDELNSDK